MPVLNGYEATMQIREISADIPIVAMTADVIQGVKEKCEEHGIYHYISKPFDPEGFIEIISNMIIHSDTRSKDINILDQATGLKYLGNNMELYKRVLNEYSRENQNTVEKLWDAIDKKQYNDAIQIVHKVKSSSGSIGANHLYSVAVKLQNSLEAGKEVEINTIYPVFVKLMKELLKAIGKYNV